MKSIPGFAYFGVCLSVAFVLAACGQEGENKSEVRDLNLASRSSAPATVTPEEIPLSALVSKSSEEIGLLDLTASSSGIRTSGISSTGNIAVGSYPIRDLAGEVLLTEASSWVAEYFNNYQADNFSSPQVLPVNPYGKPTQLANDLDLNWGNSSPAYGINSDYYSARFTALVFVANQGTMRFRYNSDDGSRAYIHSQHGSLRGQVNPTSYLTASDRQELWNDWREKSADQPDNEGQVYVYRGYYVITIEYYERAGAAELKFAAGQSITSPGNTNCQANEYKASFYQGNYYEDLGAGGDRQPPISPTFQQCLGDLQSGLKTSLSQKYLDGQPRYDLTNNYTAYFEKTLFVEKLQDTYYRLEFKADDAMKVFIDGRLIAQHSLARNGNNMQVANILLRPGAHKIVLKMLENYGDASINFSMFPSELTPPPPPVTTAGPGVNNSLLPDRCGGTNWTRYVIDGIGHKFKQGVWASILEQAVCLNSPNMSINQDITGATMRTTYYVRKLGYAHTFNFQLRADDRAWIYVNGELAATYDLAIDRGSVKTIQVSVPDNSTMVIVVEDDGGAGSLLLQRL